jgi:hypothetical protein
MEQHVIGLCGFAHTHIDLLAGVRHPMGIRRRGVRKKHRNRTKDIEKGRGGKKPWQPYEKAWESHGNPQGKGRKSKETMRKHIEIVYKSVGEGYDKTNKMRKPPSKPVELLKALHRRHLRHTLANFYRIGHGPLHDRLYTSTKDPPFPLSSHLLISTHLAEKPCEPTRAPAISFRFFIFRQPGLKAHIKDQFCLEQESVIISAEMLFQHVSSRGDNIKPGANFK